MTSTLFHIFLPERRVLLKALFWGIGGFVGLFSILGIFGAEPSPQERKERFSFLDSLQGDWRWVDTQPGALYESWLPYSLASLNLRVQGDSVFGLEEGAWFYVASRMNREGAMWKCPGIWEHAEFRHDTLVTWLDPPMDQAEHRFYVRDTLDDPQFQRMKCDTLWKPGLEGRWNLVTQMVMDYGGEPPFKVKHPVSLPPVLLFSLEDLADPDLNPREIILDIKGNPREFLITHFSQYEGQIKLKPGAWWKGKPFDVYYQRKNSGLMVY